MTIRSIWNVTVDVKIFSPERIGGNTAGLGENKAGSAAGLVAKAAETGVAHSVAEARAAIATLNATLDTIERDGGRVKLAWTLTRE